MAYDLDGKLKTRTDQRGVVMTYTYDNARRLIREGATTLPAGVDGTIKSIAHLYDALGRVAVVTSFANANGSGTIHNQIKYTYDNHGKLTKTEQSHSGAVTTGTPAVQYAYDASVQSGAYDDALRLESVTYPDGRVIFNGYDSTDTIFDRLSRIARLRETNGSGTILTEYDYNGTNRLSEARYPTPSVRNSFHGNDSDGDYEGWDRFGRDTPGTPIRLPCCAKTRPNRRCANMAGAAWHKLDTN